MLFRFASVVVAAVCLAPPMCVDAAEPVVEPGDYQLQIKAAGKSLNASVQITKGAGSSLKMSFKKPANPPLDGSLTSDGKFFVAGVIQNTFMILSGPNPTADLIQGEAKVGSIKNPTLGTFTMTRTKK